MNRKIQIKFVYNIEVILLIPTTETAHRNTRTITVLGYFSKKFLLSQ